MDILLSKEEIKNKIKSLFEGKNLKDEDFDLILKYHLEEENLSLKEKEKLKNLYLKKVENTNLSFLKDKDIKTLVSCVSLAFYTKDNILEELPIFKSLRLFKNISKIYLLYTEESIGKYQNIEKELKNKNIEVIGKEVRNDSIESIYNYLRGLAIKEEINKDNTILDVTLGLKMSGIALYKISAEHGIPSINWKELQLPIYRLENNNYIETEKVKRIPFTTKMEIMKEPLKESIRNYERLNEALENEEYNLVAGYYRNLGLNDLEFFFEELSKVFNFNVMSSLDVEEFYKKIKEFLKKIFLYENFNESTKNKIREFILTLTAMITFDEYKLKGKRGVKINRYDWSRYPNSLNILEKNIYLKSLYFSKIDDDILEDVWIYDYDENDEERVHKKISIDEFELDFDAEVNFIYKKEIYYYLVLKYFYKKTDNNNKLFSFIKSEMSKKVKKDLKEINSLEEAVEILFEENESDELINYLNITEKFKEDVTNGIYFSDNILKILKYDITIDFTKEKEFCFNKSNKRNTGILSKTNKLSEDAILLEHIFKEPNMTLDMKKIKIAYGDIKEKTLEKKLSIFKSKVIDPLNEIVKRELRNKGKIEKEFIKYDSVNKLKQVYLSKSNSIKDKRKIEVNKDFYVML